MALVSGLMALTAAGALTAQGGASVEQDIPVEIAMVLPSAVGSSGGFLSPDALLVYSNAEADVSCFAGRRRTISMAMARRSSRKMYLELGDELLPALEGDNPVDAPHIPPFYTGPRNIPDPSDGPDGTPGTADDWEITDVSFQLGGWVNVSALGAFPADAFAPNYVDANGDPVQPDPGDNDTFSRINTTMRMDFKSGAHQWRIFFGRPRPSEGGQWTNPNAGAVRIERWFPNWPTSADPSDPEVPWTIRAEEWHGPEIERQGMIVGFLYYCGTRKNDPAEYAGAYDIRWADSLATVWLAAPLRP